MVFVCFGQACVGCKAGLRSRRVLGGVGFLATLGVGVGFFCPASTPDVQLDHFLHHTPKLRIPVDMVQVLLKLLLTCVCNPVLLPPTPLQNVMCLLYY